MSVAPAERLASLPGTKNEWVRVGDLKVDTSYQRPLDKDWVRTLEENYDPTLLGVIVVSRRADGSLFVISGQHRCQATRNLLGPDQRIKCEIRTGLTVAEESAIYLGLANVKNQSVMDRFRAKVAKGDEDAVVVAGIIKAKGLVVEMGPRFNGIRAIGSVEKVYRDGGEEGLNWTLGTIIDGWGYTEDSFQGDLVLGVHQLLREDATDDLDTDRLVKVLQKNPPARVLGLARTRRVTELGSTGVNVARVLQSLYNKGLRKGKIGPQR